MKQSFFKGMAKEEAALLEKEFMESSLMRRSIAKVLQNKIEANRRLAIGISSFESPSWAFLQAYTNGFEKAMTDIISILTTE